MRRLANRQAGSEKTEDTGVLHTATDAGSRADGLIRPSQGTAGEGSADAVIDPSHIYVCEGLGTRDNLFSFVAQRSVELGVSYDAAQVQRALAEREAQGTTGMMDGFAIPHAKTSAVVRPVVLVVKDTLGIQGWDTMDNVPICVAIALLIPEGHAGSDHLSMLSRIAEALMDEDFRYAVKTSKDPREVCRVIAGYLS